MYTSLAADTFADSATAAPSGTASAVPKSPATIMKNNLNLDVQTPQSKRAAPTSSPAVATPQQPNSAPAPPGPGAVQSAASWPIDGMMDASLSGSEPRIYPGMISRRQRTNSLRQGSGHEADGTAKKGPGNMDEVEEEGVEESKE